MCACEREKKHIALQGLQSLCVLRKRKKIFTILYYEGLSYTCISPCEPPQAPCPIRSVGNTESPFLSQITAHARGDPAAKATFLTFDHDVSAA